MAMRDEFSEVLRSMGFGETQAHDMAAGLAQMGTDMASAFRMQPGEAFAKLSACIQSAMPRKGHDGS